MFGQLWRSIWGGGESSPAQVRETAEGGPGNAAACEDLDIRSRGDTGPRGSADLEEEGWGEWLGRKALGVWAGAAAGGAAGGLLGSFLGGPIGSVIGGIGGAIAGGIFGSMESHRISEAWGSPQVLETDGNDSTVYDVLGGPGTDMRDQGSGDYGQLLLDQSRQGVFPSLVPETHRALMDTTIPQAARTSLDALGQEVHNPFETGSGMYNIDEYSMVLDQLPEGFSTPEEFMAAFLRSPNDMAGHQDSPGIDFDTFNRFNLNGAGTNAPWQGGPNDAPGVGDWFHIQIPGNNGDVMIVDTQDCADRTSATVQTMTDQEWGPMNDDHPVSGRRQFGMEQLEEGGYRFYTRGFDRQTNLGMDPQVSNMAQHADWSTLMMNMSDRYGGRAERTDEDGNPIWGWARQVSGEGLAASMEGTRSTGGASGGW